MGPKLICRHAFGPRIEIERYRFDNGLTLLLVVDDAAPVVSYQTWLAVGSRHEKKGKTGIAHLFEHLMFNETDNLANGELDRKLEQAGAESNAATFLDWTFYLENLPAEALELVIELESDRLQNLVLRDPQVASEREVVANERRQTVDDDIDGTITERLYSSAFTVHGYRWPTIGLMADIQGLTTEDCRSFYASYYAPNNATLVIVGDVEREHLLELLAGAYGSIPAAPVLAEDRRTEPPQTRERRSQLSLPTATHKLAVGYHCPAMADADHPALTLLVEILFGGRASRVHQALVQQAEVASSAGGFVGNFRDPALLDIYLTARPEHDCSSLLRALDEQLEQVCRDAPSESELERGRARVELSSLRALETAAGKAEQIGFCELVLGDPAGLFARLEACAQVSRDDLLRVARRYLQPNARTIVEVSPELDHK